ncbi:hypothetical protein Pelo_2801 [Pelomyxa schiedti]|nr:hypothetical protein Pelo_2801 [Pelomyxa schiedti]
MHTPIDTLIQVEIRREGIDENEADLALVLGEGSDVVGAIGTASSDSDDGASAARLLTPCEDPDVVIVVEDDDDADEDNEDDGNALAVADDDNDVVVDDVDDEVEWCPLETTGDVPRVEECGGGGEGSGLSDLELLLPVSLLKAEETLLVEDGVEEGEEGGAREDEEVEGVRAGGRPTKEWLTTVGVGMLPVLRWMRCGAGADDVVASALAADVDPLLYADDRCECDDVCSLGVCRLR